MIICKLKVVTVSILSILFLFIVSCKEEKNNTSVKPVEIVFKKEGTLSLLKASNDSILKTIDIEIADNNYERETGLMYRKSMKDSEGMLFIFPDSQYRSFYMRNTEISLDIIYIDESKAIVSIQKNTTPLDETPLPSEAPAKYVLEIKGGLSDAWNLQIGDKIKF